MIRIFSHHFHLGSVLQMLVDFVFVLLATIAFGALDLQPGLPIATTASHGLSLAVWTSLAGNVAGLYEPSAGRALQQRVLRALVAVMLALPVAYALFWILPGPVARSSLLRYVAVGVVLSVIAHRSLIAQFGRSALLQRRILVLGTGEVARQVSESLRASDPSALVVGYFPCPNDGPAVVPAEQILKPSGSLAAAAKGAHVDEVIVALSERRSGSMSLRDLLDCKISGIRVSDLSTHFEKQLGQIRLEYVNASWLIFGEGFNQGLFRTAIKRVFDIFSALFLLILTLPVMIITTVLVALDSRGPIFYRQERVGLNGRTFYVVKFRSMRSDAERNGPRWATAADDRVTRVGRVIRKLRIDELPQLVNVLKGEMSLVGPRPERPVFVEPLTNDVPYYAVRHSIKPGVTGWAQVRYQYGSTVDDAKQKLQYDLFYVKNHTLFLDLLIMMETVSVVLTGKGAR
jgi:sugar transferase (PEP-CTERM system associated)